MLILKLRRYFRLVGGGGSDSTHLPNLGAEVPTYREQGQN